MNTSQELQEATFDWFDFEKLNQVRWTASYLETDSSLTIRKIARDQGGMRQMTEVSINVQGRDGHKPTLHDLQIAGVEWLKEHQAPLT